MDHRVTRAGGYTAYSVTTPRTFVICGTHKRQIAELGEETTELMGNSTEDALI